MEPITRMFMDGTAYVYQNSISQNPSGSWSGPPIQKLAAFEGSHLEPYQVRLLQDLAIRYISLGSPESIRRRLKEKGAMPKSIDFFNRKYRFLSNAFQVSVQVDGINYGSAEAAFYASGCCRKEDKLKIAGCTPGKARQESLKLETRSDWCQAKDAVMLEVVRQKFLQNMELKLKLLATGDAELIHGNNSHDNYWGSCTCAGCKEEYKNNKLGKALMQVRAEFRNILEPYIRLELPGETSLTAEVNADPKRPGIIIYMQQKNDCVYRVCWAQQNSEGAIGPMLDVGCNEI